MNRAFDSDPFPGRPRILFIGFGEGSHTHSWIDVLDGARFNIRLFALPTLTMPPDDWPIKTYISGVPRRRLDSSRRRQFYLPGRLGWGIRHVREALGGGLNSVLGRWLSKILNTWRPNIVHALGLDPAGLLYHQTVSAGRLSHEPTWVLQLRGGSDLTLARHDPERRATITAALRGCDQLLSDNLLNFDWCRELGVDEDRFAKIAPIPGTGGLDLDEAHAAGPVPPSGRRLILIPKAYESPWSKAMPVLDALRRVWDRIGPCDIHLLAVTEEIRRWVRDLPEEIQTHVAAEGRVPRPQVLDLMGRARVMVAPSLIDGTPNAMFEAMASGAYPIVSPLDTITPIVESPKNVLFARNLYPDEIAEALLLAMTDDDLVDRAAVTNREAVRRLADRKAIRPKVVAFYEEQAGIIR